MVLVSAIITTHKREPEIVERALKSILAQTYKNMEVIIIDDSPAEYSLRDKVKSMTEKYLEQNVRYIQHPTCQGACAARNTGLSIAEGEFIAYLDDDDEWLPNKIEKQLEAFTNENIALVYCGWEVYNTEIHSITKQDNKFYSGKIFDQLMHLGNFVGGTSFPLIRKSALETIGGFDSLMQSAQDYDVWIRLAKIYEIACVEDALVRYYVHGGEQITKNCQRKIAGMERLMQKNEEYLIKNKRAWRRHMIAITPYYAGNGQSGKAWKIWFKVVFRFPFNIIDNLRYMKRIFMNSMKKK